MYVCICMYVVECYVCNEHEYEKVNSIYFYHKIGIFADSPTTRGLDESKLKRQP